MEQESSNPETLTEARREAIEKTIAPTTVEKLRAMTNELLPFVDHPWHDLYVNFLKENANSAFYHAETGDGFGIVYCPAQHKGIWYVRKTGLGPLQEKGLQIMKELVQKH